MKGGVSTKELKHKVEKLKYKKYQKQKAQRYKNKSELPVGE